MIGNILFIIIGMLAAILFLNIWDDKKYSKVRMSFKEAIDLTGLPIVTFCQGEDRFNFLLDTGANLSVINKKALEIMAHNMIDKTTTVTGINGKPIPAECATVFLSYRDSIYEETFQVVDMTDAFKTVKEESGVSLVGILGNEFFQKNKYILDFEHLIAYSRK